MTNYVLIVDDDAPTRFVYERVLSSLGFQVLEAGDGDEALRVLHIHKPILVLLDLLLPQRSGFEVLEYIYADPELNDTCVVVISAQNRIEPRLRQQDHFLLKPVLPQQIRDLVRAANLM